jgi:hypothetical protein
MPYYDANNDKHEENNVANGTAGNNKDKNFRDEKIYFEI